MPTGEHGQAACPDVSVVMPVHDMPAKLVRRAIRSVRRQNHAGAIEVVLWDDGSGDPALRSAYERMPGSFDDATRPAGERAIVTHRTRNRRGIALARNAAVREARGQWLIWLDGDDELPSDAISRLHTTVTTTGNPYSIGQCKVVYPGGAVQVHRNARYLDAWRRDRGSTADPFAQVVFNTHGGLVRRDLFDATGGFDPWFSHAELVDWFRRLFGALPRPDAFDVVDAVTYVHHKREGSHSSDRVRVKHQRVAALQRYAHAEGVPPAELDAPMVNVETGCREYKRVERDPDSPGVELLRGVPPGPGGGLGDPGPAPARFPDVHEPVAPLLGSGTAAVVVQQVEDLRREVPHAVGDEVAVDHARPRLTCRGTHVRVVEVCADDGVSPVEFEREVPESGLGLVDPAHPLVEDASGLSAHPRTVGEHDDERAAPVLQQVGSQC